MNFDPLDTNCTTYGTSPYVMLILYRLRAALAPPPQGEEKP